MGQSTEELNTQIAGTRDHLAADLDALQDKVSPSAIVERRKAAARGRVSDLKSKVMGTAGSVGDSAPDVKGAAQGVASRTGDTIEGSPIAAGLVAFGAGVVLAGLLPTSAKEAQVASRLVDTAKDQAQPLIDDARSAGQDLGESLKETAGQAVDEVRSTAQDSAETVKQEGTSSAEAVRSEAQG